MVMARVKKETKNLATCTHVTYIRELSAMTWCKVQSIQNCMSQHKHAKIKTSVWYYHKLWNMIVWKYNKYRRENLLYVAVNVIIPKCLFQCVQSTTCLFHAQIILCAYQWKKYATATMIVVIDVTKASQFVSKLRY